MEVRSTLKRYAIEYATGKRALSDCAVPGIRWSSLRRVLVSTKQYIDARSNKHTTKSSSLLEKKRAESRFWLETGIKWPDITSEV